MARRYASRRRSYGRKTKRGAVRKRSYKRKSIGKRRTVRAPRQASGSSMNGYSVFNMPFSSYGKGNSGGIGRAINDKALRRAQRINTRLGAYYKADSQYRAQVADQQKILAIRQANAKRVADANFGVDLYNEIGTGLAGLANMIVPGLGVPIQAVVSGTTPAFRQLAGGDQTFRPGDLTKGLSNFAPLIQWAGPQMYAAAIPAMNAAGPAIAAAYQNGAAFAGAQYGRVKGHVMDRFNFGLNPSKPHSTIEWIDPPRRGANWDGSHNKISEYNSRPRFDFIDLYNIEPSNYRPEDFSPRPTQSIGPLREKYNHPDNAFASDLIYHSEFDPRLKDYATQAIYNTMPKLEPLPVLNPDFIDNPVNAAGYTRKTFRRERPPIPNDNIFIDLEEIDQMNQPPVINPEQLFLPRRSNRNNIYRGGYY